MKSKFLWLSLAVVVVCLFPAKGSAQGCQMTAEYSTYDSESYDGTYLYVSETIDGYTLMGNPEYCPAQRNAMHTAKVYNVISSIGGWMTGASVPAASYLQLTNSQQIAALTDTDYLSEIESEIICSIVGTFFGTGIFAHTYSIRLSAYTFAGLSSGRCAWVPSCAGKCSSQHTTNTFNGVCYTTGPYKQCFDLLRDGVCWDYRTFCYGKSAPGLCTN